MAVRVIESIDPKKVSLKKISVDGIQNTIKYEISSEISYNSNKRLTVEAEISEAIQNYSRRYPESEASLKSLSQSKLTLSVVVPNDIPLSIEAATDIVEEILSECDYLNQGV